MANIIRYISSFSDDAVYNAIQNTIGTDDVGFINKLKEIQSALEKPPKKMKKESRLFKLSDKTIFEQKILPQIREKVADFDRLETSGKQQEWKVRLDFIEDYSVLDMNALKQRHALILEDERNIANLELIAKYYRGNVYVHARQLIKDEENVKDVFRREFGVCYDTVWRYATFAALIKHYPRLLICGLVYAQITKHQKRLLDYLKTDALLHDQLSQPFHITAQDKDVSILPAEIDVPNISFSYDADYVYEDFFYNDEDYAGEQDTQDSKEEIELSKWFQEAFKQFAFDDSSHNIPSDTDMAT